MNKLADLAKKIGFTAEEIVQVQEQVARFIASKLKWAPEENTIFHRMPPLEWWTWVGVIQYPLLSLIAQMIFTIPTSSAAAERGWSIHGNIHTNRRDSLDNERTDMLEFITPITATSNTNPQSSSKHFLEMCMRRKVNDSGALRCRFGQ
ncbi:unnamed protein product [Phytophthora fragariaefolia]|uniref:Unnamed protein product n=1 Tax=Phytophthora fragariaefolia TaxID=1490495 RepID=A0A9W7DBE9_9STRA|nr:unnamed protein product [Phytophthora fragariaefolia]